MFLRLFDKLDFNLSLGFYEQRAFSIAQYNKSVIKGNPSVTDSDF
jgi:hypothetical protein